MTDISLKGLDTFSKRFLFSNEEEEKEYIHVAPGQQLSAAALKRYAEERQREFIQRSGTFAEDLLAFIVEQKRMRQLKDTETVFALALANINLRNSYGSPQNEAPYTLEKRTALLAEFDEICAGAQDYYDANQ
jgi:hypothetical protein